MHNLKYMAIREHINEAVGGSACLRYLSVSIGKMGLSGLRRLKRQIPNEVMYVHIECSVLVGLVGATYHVPVQDDDISKQQV